MSRPPGKRGQNNQDCYQRKVQNPASVMVWGCVSVHVMANLNICDGTINPDAYYICYKGKGVFIS